MHTSLKFSGTSGHNTRGATGSSDCFFARIVHMSPRNGSRPVSASYNIAPTAYQSLAAATSPPDACSGAMYGTEPTMSRSLVNALNVASDGRESGPPVTLGTGDDRALISFAIPKSRITK